MISQAERALGQLSGALEAAGWKLSRGRAGSQRDFQVVRAGQRLPIEFRYAREPRQAVLRGLLADAILSGRARVGSRGKFVALVAAPVISPAMASSLDQYVSEVARGQPFGYVDERGLVRFHAPGLEEVRADPARRRSGGGSQALKQPRDLFSDMNQWMLKVLVGRPLEPNMLSIPREPVGSAAELGDRADASVPAAWRLLSALRGAGHLDDAGAPVRVPEILARWRAAALRPQREIAAVWIMPGRDPLERLRRSLADVAKRGEPVSACLGLFAACDALGVGHVRGAPVHLYVRRAEPELLDELGLAAAEPGRPGDVVVRVARWPESVFRAAVRAGGVPIADVLQCWLDVSSHPARGAEQAEFIWKRVLGPALAPKEPQP